MAQIRQLSFGKLLLMVFAPAILLLGVYIASLGLRETIPVFVSFMSVGIVVLITAELGIIMASSKKETGKANLSSAFAGHVKIPFGKILLYSIIPFCVAAVVFMFLGPYENEFLLSTVFKWIPEYFRLSDAVNIALRYPSYYVPIAIALGFLFNGLLGPIVEELFFRGFLMPRIERFGKWVPLIITVLFSLYHLFSPWENLTRILAVYPLTYTVWKKKNIYIGMVIHCSLNTISMIGTALVFLA